MTEEEGARLLDSLAGRVPVTPAPVDRVLLRGRRRLRRRRGVQVFSVGAAVAVTIIGGSAFFPGPGTDIRQAATPPAATQPTTEEPASRTPPSEPALACAEADTQVTLFDQGEPAPGTSLDDAVEPVLDRDGGEWYVFTSVAASEAVAYVAQPDGRATARIHVQQWSNGGWAVDAIAECKRGATAEPAEAYLGVSERHQVRTYHCGIPPTVFQGRVWKVQPGFNEEPDTIYSDSFTGTGTMTRLSDDTAKYVDDDGTVIPFVAEVSGTVEGCD